MAISLAPSLDDLATVRRTCRGEVPPPLVGASTTVVGNSIWVFGGRRTGTRRMRDDLWELDLDTLVWTKRWPLPGITDDTVPGPEPRYFHSATSWGSHSLVVFGGQTVVAPEAGGATAEPSSDEADTPVQLHTLADLAVWDIASGKWNLPSPCCREGVAPPVGRYAHLGVVSEAHDSRNPGVAVRARLTLLGGQDALNRYLFERHVLDLNRMEWVAADALGRNVGGYRSVAVASEWTVNQAGRSGELESSASSTRPDENALEPIIVFTNAGVSHPRHELDLVASPFAPLAPADPTTYSILLATSPASDSDASSNPVGPPGLRFPQGAIVGTHLVLSGLHVTTPSVPKDKTGAFVVWALPLGDEGTAGLRGQVARGSRQPAVKGQWRQVATGSALKGGSWSRAVVHDNQLIVLGAAERDILEDYARRETHFSEIVLISLQASAIYQPPPAPLPLELQSLGLLTLRQPHLADFEILTLDGSFACSRHLLALRWPWFQSQLATFDAKVADIVDVQGRRSSKAGSAESPASPASHRLRGLRVVSPRQLVFPARRVVVQALIEFVYALGLVTVVQRDERVLMALLGLPGAAVGDGAVPGLKEGIVHVLHAKLSPDNCVAVWEAATLGGCWGLQVRCMQMMLMARRLSRTATAFYSPNDDSLVTGATHSPLPTSTEPAGPVGKISSPPLSVITTRHPSLAISESSPFTVITPRALAGYAAPDDGSSTPKATYAFPAPPFPAPPNYSFPGPRDQQRRRSSTQAMRQAQELALLIEEEDELERVSRVRTGSIASLASVAESTASEDTAGSGGTGASVSRRKKSGRSSMLDAFRSKRVGTSGEVPLLEVAGVQGGGSKIGLLFGIGGGGGGGHHPHNSESNAPRKPPQRPSLPPHAFSASQADVIASPPRRTSSITNLRQHAPALYTASPTELRRPSLGPSISSQLSPGIFDRPPPPNLNALRRPSAVSMASVASMVSAVEDVTPWELEPGPRKAGRSPPGKQGREGLQEGELDSEDEEEEGRRARTPRSPGESWKKLL